MSEQTPEAKPEEQTKKGKGGKSKLLSAVGTQFLAAGMYSAFIGIIVAYVKLAGQFPKEFQMPLMWCGVGSMIVIQVWFLFTSVLLMQEKSITDRLMARQERDLIVVNGRNERDLAEVEGKTRINEATLKLLKSEKALEAGIDKPAIPPP